MKTRECIKKKMWRGSSHARQVEKLCHSESRKVCYEVVKRHDNCYHEKVKRHDKNMRIETKNENGHNECSHEMLQKIGQTIINELPTC